MVIVIVIVIVIVAVAVAVSAIAIAITALRLPESPWELRHPGCLHLLSFMPGFWPAGWACLRLFEAHPLLLTAHPRQHPSSCFFSSSSSSLLGM